MEDYLSFDGLTKMMMMVMVVVVVVILWHPLLPWTLYIHRHQHRLLFAACRLNYHVNIQDMSRVRYREREKTVDVYHFC